MASNVHVILSRDVSTLGRVGEVVKVRPGYARNYLFPRQFALPVSPERLQQFEHQKRMVAHQLQKLRQASEDVKVRMASVQVNISVKAGEQGKLFGSVGTRDIEKAMHDAGFTISHRDVKLENPIKTVGLHQVEVRLEADVKAIVNVVIVPIEEPKPVVEAEAVQAEAAVEAETSME
jgi:large subunit ribosomal protein L9